MNAFLYVKSTAKAQAHMTVTAKKNVPPFYAFRVKYTETK